MPYPCTVSPLGMGFHSWLGIVGIKELPKFSLLFTEGLKRLEKECFPFYSQSCKEKQVLEEME
jgi:hypothetical protein